MILRDCQEVGECVWPVRLHPLHLWQYRVVDHVCTCRAFRPDLLYGVVHHTPNTKQAIEQMHNYSTPEAIVKLTGLSPLHFESALAFANLWQKAVLVACRTGGSAFRSPELLFGNIYVHPLVVGDLVERYGLQVTEM